MSYDILAFDPQATTDEGFERWWDDRSQWTEDHSYADPQVTTPALRAFYQDLIPAFPPMNGPDAPSDEQIDEDPDLDARLTDYSIGSDLLYAAASWSKAEAVRGEFERLGRLHGVAVAFVSETPLRIQRQTSGGGSPRG